MATVKRFLAVTAAGKILNPKTARSQIIGGNVWGIGMALTEESVIDPRWGNFIARSSSPTIMRLPIWTSGIWKPFLSGKKILFPTKWG